MPWLVTDKHLELERLNLALRLSPVTFQEYIPGTTPFPPENYRLGSRGAEEQRSRGEEITSVILHREGSNIRTYVIGDEIYSSEIRSHSLDFREDSQAQLIHVNLPKVIEQQCLAITKALMLEWTAIDWRLKPTGEYVFLEANPSPMFLHFEQQTGFEITQSLVKLLLQPFSGK